jgi:hypothetical protein
MGGPYVLRLVDRQGNAANGTIDVVLGPSVATPTASPASVGLGGSVTFATTASSGVAPYTYHWLGLPDGCASIDQASLTCTPQSVGIFSVSLTVTDSNNFTATSGVRSFSVYPFYTVTFTETGLPNGTAWGVAVANQIETSLHANLSFPEGNGTYSYLVLEVAGYATSNAGYFVVNGSNVVVGVNFHRQVYPVVFIVLGLPSGSNWSVTVSNVSAGFNHTYSSVGNSLLVFLPNGTYSVSFTLPLGYSGNFSSTQITVAGRTTGATLGATAPATHTSPGNRTKVNATSTPAGNGYALLSYGLAAVVAALAVALAVVTRRRPPTPSVAGRPGTTGEQESPRAAPPFSDGGDAEERSVPPGAPVAGASDPLDEVI